MNANVPSLPYNGTDHDICFFRPEDVDDSNPRKLVVKDGASPFLTIHRQEPLNAEQREVLEDNILGVPVYDVEPHKVADLPEGYDSFIVSALYGSAYKQLAEIAEANGEMSSRLVTLYGVRSPVYKKLEDGSLQVAGCIGLRIAYQGFAPEN